MQKQLKTKITVTSVMIIFIIIGEIVLLNLLYGTNSMVGIGQARVIDFLLLPLQILIILAILYCCSIYEVNYRERYEKYMKGKEQNSFFSKNYFLYVYGRTWREEYLPVGKQEGPYYYKAFWSSDGHMVVMIYDRKELIYCKRLTPEKALSVIENVNYGYLPEKLSICIPSGKLELIRAYES